MFSLVSGAQTYNVIPRIKFTREGANFVSRYGFKGKLYREMERERERRTER